MFLSSNLYESLSMKNAPIGVLFPGQDNWNYSNLSRKEEIEFLQGYFESFDPKVSCRVFFEETNKKITISIVPKDNTVEAGILSTRLWLKILKSKEAFFYKEETGTKKLIQIKIDLLSEENRNKVITLAKVYRKLKFIEEKFGIKFSVPTTINSYDLAKIETVFRGITRGVVYFDTERITLEGFQPNKESLPELTENVIKDFSFKQEGIELFGQNLLVGTISIQIPSAKIVNIEKIHQLSLGSLERANLEVLALNKVVFLVFQEFIRDLELQRKELEDFIKQLSLKESENISKITSEPILGYITDNEAKEIAFNKLSPEWRKLVTEGLVRLEAFLDKEHSRWLIFIVEREEVIENELVCLAINKDTGEVIGEGYLISNKIREIISQGIEIKDSDSIMNYLERYTDIIDILSSICKKVKQEFDKDVKLSLEVYKDPEIDHEYLIIYMKPTKYDKNVEKIINNILDEYEEALSECQGWLLLTTDFRSSKQVYAV